MVLPFQPHHIRTLQLVQVSAHTVVLRTAITAVAFFSLWKEMCHQDDNQAVSFRKRWFDDLEGTEKLLLQVLESQVWVFSGQ